MKSPLSTLLFALLFVLAVGRPVAAQQFESAHIIPPPPASGDQYHNFFFGSSVDASGNWLAVADFAAGVTGEVYLYRHDGAQWRYRQTIAEASGWVFGWGMALDNKTLVVGDAFWGAPRKSLGRVHIYERRGQVWYPLQVINADGLGSHIAPDFGWDVAVSGDVLVIGAGNTNTFIEHAGLIRIYEKQNGLWEFAAEFRLRPSRDARDELTTGLGRAVAVHGTTVVAAAPNPTGAVFVWERHGGIWQFAAELESPGEDHGDTFGASLDIDGDTIVVGAPAFRGISGRQGEAYVYERAGGVWQHAGSLVASDGFSGVERGDEFGSSVSVLGERILVGALNANFNGPHTGTAYLFERTQSGWPVFENERLAASDSSGFGDHLGGSSVLTQSSAIVGATGAWVRSAKTGEVYVFDHP